ncbi:MAG: deoxyribodipyrimidine photo-lyase [Methylococcaceae bacterium]|jgi:deoxyribodipyrimidine photo-lyase
MPRYKQTLFLFRRDLRLVDNSALNAALQASQRVIAGFVFDDRQIQPHAYQSKPALAFMQQSLVDLKQQFQAINAEIALFKGLPEQIIIDLHKQYAIQAVFINRDYSPFSRRRDAEIAHTCQQLGIVLHVLPDALLCEPEQALKADASPYKVFTAFYNHSRLIPIALPQNLATGCFLTVPSTATLALIPVTTPLVIDGGRSSALKQLTKLIDCQHYEANRDFPALSASSGLSAHLKFGTLSVREVFYAIIGQLGEQHPLLRQLYWRDFFSHIGYHFPNVFGHAFVDKFDKVPWDNKLEYFHAWADGKTGFPLVDAGMRELNATGLMHNRVRMVTASFLVKDLHINWRWGERYFAQHLVDYDPCVNNGNWQWAASTGCDAQPYFRIFNPWLQQQKFDPLGNYIYKWLPELQAVPVKILHQWQTKHFGGFYPAPIINHAEAVQITKARFKAC